MKSSSHDLLRLIALLSFFLRLPLQEAYAQKPVDFDQAIKRMEKFENRMVRVQWEVKTRSATFPANANFWVPTPEFDEGWVIYEPKTGRYRVELSSVSKWTRGTLPFIAMKHSYAFDGDVSRKFSREKPGTNLPADGDHPGEGVVLKGNAKDLQYWGGRCGSTYFPPFFGIAARFLPSFSHSLKHAREKGDLVEITETRDGDWEIKTNDPPAVAYAIDPANDPHRGFVTITYSPSKGAVVLASHANGKPLREYHRIVVDLQKIDGDFWVPKSVHDFNTIDMGTRHIYYDRVKINHAVKDEVFRFDFPAGAMVDDQIKKKEYRARAPKENEKKDPEKK